MFCDDPLVDDIGEEMEELGALTDADLASSRETESSVSE